MLLNDIDYNGYIVSKECSLLVNLKGHENCGQLLGEFAKLRKETISFVMSVCPIDRPSVRPSVYPSALNNWAPTGRIFMKFDI
jgi:hypothetical protein